MRYENLSRSAGLKKWVTAAVAADYGDSQALWVPPRVPFALGIAVGSASLHNRSGAAVSCGLGARFPVGIWQAGTVTAAGVYTADTADAQDADTGDLVLHDRTDSGSGILIGSEVPFNIVDIIQSVAGDQTTPVLLVEYWNGAAWTDLVAVCLIADALNGGSVPRENVICFPQPSDWAVGGTGTGVPSTTYNLRLRQTTSGAGTANPLASQAFIGHAKMLLEALGDNGVSALIRDHEYIFPRSCEALFPLFSVANRGNAVEADVRA